MRSHLRTLGVLATAVTISTAALKPAACASFVSLRVEQGDTYTNLFGPDWQKAYRQNKMTVVRNGRPVTSADILIEGSVISVTGDVRLTPRASARLAALSKRRSDLTGRLADLAPRLATAPQAQAVAEECRKQLADDKHFAADVDFIEREIAHLEALVLTVDVPRPRPQSQSTNSWWLGFAVAATALATAILWKRQRPRYPEGAARYREALSDLRAAFRHVGPEL
jgi:hypothetical protein